jgi:hypothetical protein
VAKGRIRREYEGNTKGIRRQHACIAQATGLLHAFRWLWVALAPTSSFCNHKSVFAPGGGGCKLCAHSYPQ